MEAFVTHDSFTDPWSIPYKHVTDKLHQEDVLTVLKFDNEPVRDLNDMARRFVDKLLPTQNEQYTREQEQINRQAEHIRATRNSRRICEQELEAALKTMNKWKAPGYKSITVEMLHHV